MGVETGWRGFDEANNSDGSDYFQEGFGKYLGSGWWLAGNGYSDMAPDQTFRLYNSKTGDKITSLISPGTENVKDSIDKFGTNCLNGKLTYIASDTGIEGNGIVTVYIFDPNDYEDYYSGSEYVGGELQNVTSFTAFTSTTFTMQDEFIFFSINNEEVNKASYPSGTQFDLQNYNIYENLSFIGCLNNCYYYTNYGNANHFIIISKNETPICMINVNAKGAIVKPFYIGANLYFIITSDTYDFKNPIVFQIIENEDGTADIQNLTRIITDFDGDTSQTIAIIDNKLFVNSSAYSTTHMYDLSTPSEEATVVDTNSYWSDAFSQDGIKYYLSDTIWYRDTISSDTKISDEKAILCLNAIELSSSDINDLGFIVSTYQIDSDYILSRSGEGASYLPNISVDNAYAYIKVKE